MQPDAKQQWQRKNCRLSSTAVTSFPSRPITNNESKLDCAIVRLERPPRSYLNEFTTLALMNNNLVEGTFSRNIVEEFHSRGRALEFELERRNVNFMRELDGSKNVTVFGEQRVADFCKSR